jgi:DNA-directed RNA polymerase subunit RPC12/RpoP
MPRCGRPHLSLGGEVVSTPSQPREEYDRVRVKVECKQCEEVFWINKLKGVDQYNCPDCGSNCRVKPQYIKKPRSFPQAFNWWAKRSDGNLYPFDCPQCRTRVDLKKRVATSKRICPACGFRVTTEAIDADLCLKERSRRQLIEEEDDDTPTRSGCAVVLLILIPILLTIVRAI